MELTVGALRQWAAIALTGVALVFSGCENSRAGAGTGDDFAVAQGPMDGGARADLTVHIDLAEGADLEPAVDLALAFDLVAARDFTVKADLSNTMIDKCANQPPCPPMLFCCPRTGQCLKAPCP